MKIVAGRFGGRSITMPDTPDTRPVTLMVRSSIFNVIGDLIKNATVLDLFAGSGALGLESLSRGAKSVVFVDVGKRPVQVIKKNIAELQLIQLSKVIQQEAIKYLKNSSDRFDVIFLDPPYREMEESLVINCQTHLNLNGVLIVSHSKNTLLSATIGTLQCVKQSNYGDTTISYYQLKA